ncbi:MAG: beta-galactosidase trimerization domain-containing protein [Armatimonadota bacterium]|nr:beta-galactosidase trimerization domain-containing protein [Armatimonadota bacterium]
MDIKFPVVIVFCLLMLNGAPTYAQEPFTLAPAVAFEAEDFTIERGWKPIRMGEGNYCVDMIGFSHTSGERFLHADAKDVVASASIGAGNAPQAGPYRLWVRYEYMPFTESRFKVSVEQNGKVVAEKIMGTRESLRTTPWSDGTQLVKQYDPPWGNEGLTEEPLDIAWLEHAPVRIRLQTVEQPWIPGLTANRNIDMFYLTSDTMDEWRHHAPYNGWYGILNAARDTLGARYVVRYMNRGDKPMSFDVRHTYNRLPWWVSESSAGVKDLAPGATSDWMPILGQDTSHFGMARFIPSVAQPFTVAVRPYSMIINRPMRPGVPYDDWIAEELVESNGDWVGIFLPTYPNKGEKAVTAIEELDKILASLKASPAPGKVPTKPLCYGGAVPYGDTAHDYGTKYAQFYAALGMRSFPRIPDALERARLKGVGIDLNKSVAYGEYRFPPTAANIAKAKKAVDEAKMGPYMRWFDYGDEIGFSEWVTYMMAEKKAELKNPDLKTEDVIHPLWQKWLEKNRLAFKPADYWRTSWGKIDPAQMRPDSSAEASAEKPKLFVDSTIFYEDMTIAWVAKGARAIKQALGPDVLCGANYSCYPYYYPHSTMYVKWFRQGAADFGRHSEYFWQMGQVTPIVNGYISEHFRAGMRFNPKAIVKQYTMPHSPGNTDGDFLRTAFSHLAHGVKNLDFFGMGMNETFTENHIDHRDTSRFVALRDITHSMGLVEDVLEQSHVVPSQVALLLSQSTERWDHSRIAQDFVTSGPDFRKDRLTYHQDRVGIYTALTFAGSSPDILVEDDVLNPKILDGYKVIFLVGDCIPGSLAPALDKWVKAGGVVFATAGVGRYGAYKEANPALQRFVGVASRKIEERDTFLRTSQELPFLKPITNVVGKGWQFPALATRERITPVKGAQVLATFKDDKSPAMIVRALGKGKVYYLAALPGMAYVWTGLTTPEICVPDRGPNTHRVVNTYDKNAARVIGLPLVTAGVKPRIGNVDYIDTRLIAAPGGVFMLPLANYREPTDDQVTITIRPPAGAKPLKSVVSAFCGPVKAKTERGMWTITLPKLGYGDMVRINVK